MRTVAFFNNKGGVGKTSLVYHLVWMYQHLGLRIVAADLDPQSNLTSMFLPEERLEAVWPEGEHPLSILGTVRPIIRGVGDIAVPHIEPVTDIGLLHADLQRLRESLVPHVEPVDAEIGLIIGDLGLSLFEDNLSAAWPRCLDGQEAAFRTTSAFYRVLRRAAANQQADIVLIDVGPNLGALNRAALIAAEHVVIPLASDLFSLQGLRNLGPTLRRWREEWQERLRKNPDPELDLPSGSMNPVGYVVVQHAVRLDRPVQAYARWTERIPAEYRRSVLGLPDDGQQRPEEDPNRLALIKHFRSLMPMAQEARKPMFDLRPADGAIGAHAQNVQTAYRDFEDLAVAIAARIGMAIPA